MLANLAVALNFWSKGWLCFPKFMSIFGMTIRLPFTADNTLFKVNNENTRAMGEICPKLNISHQSVDSRLNAYQISRAVPQSTSCKATLLKSYFCYIFSGHIFLRTPLKDCFYNSKYCNRKLLVLEGPLF